MTPRHCDHCGGLIEIRNPTSYCDHLYYPDNCATCKAAHKSPREKLFDEILMVLEHAKTKLEIFRAHTNGKYQGGMEYCMLMIKIDDVLNKAKGETNV